MPYDCPSCMPYLEVVLGLVVLELNVQAVFDTDLHLGMGTGMHTATIEGQAVASCVLG